MMLLVHSIPSNDACDSLNIHTPRKYHFANEKRLSIFLRHLGGFFLFIYQTLVNHIRVPAPPSLARLGRMARRKTDEIFSHSLGSSQGKSHKIHFYHLALIIISIFYSSHGVDV